MSDDIEHDLDEDSLEKADVEVAEEAAKYRHNPVIKTLGTFSEISDQPQLTALCATVVAAGLVTGNAGLARTGGRMMAAHVLANSVKRVIKSNFRRTRPNEMIKSGEYESGAGKTEGGHERSFPSGHTAGAMAVAAIVATDQPRLAVPALGTAAVIAAVQVPRGKHYPADVAAGTVLGLAAAWVINRLWANPDREP